jgi:hypothetical protein
MAAVQELRRTTYQLLLDLKVEEGLAIKIEPHPRFYTDPADTVPIAVPALLREWWPMIFFLVFKSPAEGRTHIFRANEPFAQCTVIPADSDLELVGMSAEEAAERELRLGEFTRAVPLCPLIPDGFRRRTRYLTRLTGASMARRGNSQAASKDGANRSTK